MRAQKREEETVNGMIDGKVRVREVGRRRQFIKVNSNFLIDKHANNQLLSERKIL